MRAPPTVVMEVAVKLDTSIIVRDGVLGCGRIIFQTIACVRGVGGVGSSINEGRIQHEIKLEEETQPDNALAATVAFEHRL